MRRRRFGVPLVSLALLVPAGLRGPNAVAAATGWQPQEEAQVVVVEGRGYGHGVGMAQDGAYAMGAAGASVNEILTAFYPGTALARRGGTVRVDLGEDAPPTVVLAFPGGGELRDAQSGGQSPGFPVTVAPGGSVQLSLDGGRYRATPQAGATPAPVPAPPPPPPAPPPAPPAPTTTAAPLLGVIPVAPPPPPPTAAPPVPAPRAPPPPPAEPTSTRPLWAVPRGGSSLAVPAQGRRYRGVIRAEAAGSGLHLVNELDVEQYLRGMGEVLEPGWPAASLRAQAIAARTYALRAMATDGRLCNSQQCQVYLGETVEYAAMNRAVADTRGQVLVQGGSLIEAVYSANGGGVSATPIEGFGADFGDFPYLRSAPYPTLDPSPWTVRLELGAFASRVGYPGRATAARVSQAGPSGRALEVTVDGDAGPMVVAGLRFVEILGLRSALFSLRVGDPAVVGSADPAQPSTGAVGELRPPEGPPTVVRAGREVLGRSPWVALALLLLAGWGTAAAAAVGGRRRAGPLRTGGG